MKHAWEMWNSYEVLASKDEGEQNVGGSVDPRAGLDCEFIDAVVTTWREVRRMPGRSARTGCSRTLTMALSGCYVTCMRTRTACCISGLSDHRIMFPDECLTLKIEQQSRVCLCLTEDHGMFWLGTVALPVEEILSDSLSFAKRISAGWDVWEFSPETEGIPLKSKQSCVEEPRKSYDRS